MAPSQVLLQPLSIHSDIVFLYLGTLWMMVPAKLCSPSQKHQTP